MVEGTVLHQPQGLQSLIAFYVVHESSGVDGAWMLKKQIQISVKPNGVLPLTSVGWRFTQTHIVLVTLSLVTLLFRFGWFAGRSTCKSAVVGRPGFTTVTRLSSGILVSCRDKNMNKHGLYANFILSILL